VDRGFRAGTEDRSIEDLSFDDDSPAGLPVQRLDANQPDSLPILDASIIDVYTNSQCAFICVDPGCRKTWEFAQRKLKELKSYKSISILLILNFRDRKPPSKLQSENLNSLNRMLKENETETAEGRMKRTSESQNDTSQWLSEHDVRAYLESLGDDEDGKTFLSRCEVCEASMKFCFGLSTIYHFLSIPYFRLKEASLQRQLELGECLFHCQYELCIL